MALGCLALGSMGAGAAGLPSPGMTLPQPPGVPVPNPLMPPLLAEPHNEAPPCQFAPPSTDLMRTVYTAAEPPRQALQAPVPLVPVYLRQQVSLSVDPWAPCHLFRSFADHVERSESNGASWATVFTEPGQTDPASPSGAGRQVGFDAAAFAPLAYVGPGQAYLVDGTGNDGVFYTGDQGASWSERNGGLVTAPYAPTALLGPHSVVFETPFQAPSGIQASVFAPSNPQIGYVIAAVAGETVFYRTRDGGRSWLPLPVPQPELLTVTVDPADADHVFVAGGSWQTPSAFVGSQAGVSTPSSLQESHDGGLTWAPIPAPLGISPYTLLATRFAVTPGAPASVHLYATVLDSRSAPQNDWFIERFRSDDDGATWSQLPMPTEFWNPVEHLQPSDLVADPLDNRTMVWVSSEQVTAGQDFFTRLTVEISTDGFATAQRLNIDEPGGVVSFNAVADRFHDVFVGTSWGGQGASMDTLRVIHLTPGVIPPWGAFGKGSAPLLGTCPLAPIPLSDSNPQARANAASSNNSNAVNAADPYWNGSIAYDGADLDYSQDDLAPGVIYRVNPVTCAADPAIHLHPLPSYHGSWASQGPAIEALTYDPHYRFPDGTEGAILARGHLGDDGSVADPSSEAPVYAVNPTTGDYRLAMGVQCRAHREYGMCDFPTGFSYATERDALWASVLAPDPRFSVNRLALQAIPRDGHSAPQYLPTCMTDIPWGDNEEPFGPESNFPLDWVDGGHGILYADTADEETAYAVDAATCAVGEHFQHHPVVPSDEAMDQIACDGVTFGDRPGSGGPSALWVRDSHANTVSAYAIPDNHCPFPTSVTLAATRPVAAGSSVSLCAVLRRLAATPVGLAGQTLAFSIAGRRLTAVTGEDGSTCTAPLPLTLPGSDAVRVDFGGTVAYLPASDTGVQDVVAIGGPQASGANPAPPAALARTAPGGVIIPVAPPLAPAPPEQVPTTQSQTQAQSQPQPEAQAAPQPGVMPQEEPQAQLGLQGTATPTEPDAHEGAAAPAQSPVLGRRTPPPSLPAFIVWVTGGLMGMLTLRRPLRSRVAWAATRTEHRPGAGPHPGREGERRIRSGATRRRRHARSRK